MTTQTAKIKDGSLTITLPEMLQKSWGEEEVLVIPYTDRIIIERPRRNGRIFSSVTEKKLKALGRKISKKEIEEAIQWARKQTK